MLVYEVIIVTDMLPLSQILKILKEGHQVTLHRTNLTAKIHPIPDDKQSETLSTREEQKESFLDNLARKGLAKTVGHGQRLLWYVSPDAIPELLTLARNARPGPEPITQITLDLAQMGKFFLHIATIVDPANPSSMDPVEAARSALATATGWTDSKASNAERIVISLTPRPTKEIKEA